MLVLSLSLMVLDLRFGYALKVRSFFSYLTSPVQMIVSWPIKTYNQLTNSVLSQKELLRENIQLRHKQVLLKGRLQKLLTLEKENDRLRHLLLYKKTSKNAHFVLAELLMVKTTPYRQLIMLDRGKKENVYIGQAVFDAMGVVGQVVEAGPFTSTVQLITDPNSAVPIKNTRTGERGILVGLNQLDTLSLIHLPRTSLVKVGDELVTSGLGKRFEEGYPIGTVARVVLNINDPFMTVEVKPKAKLSKSRLMLLTWHSESDRDLLNELSNAENKRFY